MAGRPTPAAVSRVLREGKPTIFYGVPTLYGALLASPELPARGELALRRCVSAGEALPEDIGKRWEARTGTEILDRKSTRLNSSHQIISYAVFCLKKKKKQKSE